MIPFMSAFVLCSPLRVFHPVRSGTCTRKGHSNSKIMCPWKSGYLSSCQRSTIGAESILDGDMLPLTDKRKCKIPI